MTTEQYHAEYLPYDPRRKIVWQTLVRQVFQALIAADSAVLDLGAGYGDFINAVRARKRIAVDHWAGMLEHLDTGVEGLVTSVTELEGVEDDSVDFAFSSNCFEHLTPGAMQAGLNRLRKKMKKGATLDIVQPNYRFCSRRYFEDHTHETVYTDTSLGEVLTANGFTVTRCMPRFMPLTIKSRFPVHPLLIRLYLWSPVKPWAKQMWIRASR